MTTDKNIVWLKISEVKNNPENPRVLKDDKFKKLVSSIREFPEMLLLRPLVVNKNKVVLGGNMRLRALHELKYKDVPVVIADNLTAEQEREFVIKDNVSFGEWDWDILANEWDSTALDAWGLDVVTNDNSEEIDEQENTTEKKIEITLQREDYKETVDLIDYWQKKDAYIGGMFLNYLRDEKRKFKTIVEKNNHV